jgi:hypothetical protein
MKLLSTAAQLGKLRCGMAGVCMFGLAAGVAARGDTVTLDNGKSLEGHVVDNGDTITVEMAQGSVKLAKARVKAISTKVTPEDEYRSRCAEIQGALSAHELEPAAAAARFFELAEWAGEQGLSRGRAECLRRTIDLDPDHAGAREALGFVLQDGRWLTKAEHYKEMGFVLHKGQWVSPEALREAQAAKDAARKKAREAERAEAERQRKKAEAEKKIEAEQDLADALQQQADNSRAQSWGAGRYNFGPWYSNGIINGWAPSLYVDPYATYFWVPSTTTTTTGRTGSTVTPGPTPGPFGPQLRNSLMNP